MPEIALGVLVCLQACSVLYALYIGVHAAYFKQAATLPQPLRPLNDWPMVSVVVPARNEADTITHCLEALARQTYQAGKLELIVVDDHSTDGTAAVVQTFAEAFGGRLQVLDLASHSLDHFGKKAALAAGIAQAKGTIILTTDADCIAAPTWVQTMTAYFEPGVAMVSGPLRKQSDGSASVATNLATPTWVLAEAGYFEPDETSAGEPLDKQPSRPSFFTEVQALEAAGMMALGAAAIAMRKPTLANGANLGFRRDAFMEVGGYTGLDGVASGDDELLLHRFHQQHQRIVFANHPDALVTAGTVRDWRAFAQQRLRWVSKSRAYNNPWITAGQVNAYLGMLGIAATGVAALFWHRQAYMLVALLLLKMSAENILLRKATAFTGQPYLLKRLLPAQLPHILYVLWVGAAGNLVRRYQWKGRQVQ